MQGDDTAKSLNLVNQITSTSNKLSFKMEFIPIASPELAKRKQKLFMMLQLGWISMGRKAKEFEELASEYICANYALAMNNAHYFTLNIDCTRY